MGHSAQDVWNYTPRRIQASIFLATKRHRRRLSEDLSVGSMASRGDPRVVRRQIKDWRDK